jgi:hypothetical protein
VPDAGQHCGREGDIQGSVEEGGGPCAGGPERQCNRPILAGHCRRMKEHVLWQWHNVESSYLSGRQLLVDTVRDNSSAAGGMQTHIPSSTRRGARRAGDERPVLSGDTDRRPSPGSSDMFTQKHENYDGRWYCCLVYCYIARAWRGETWLLQVRVWYDFYFGQALTIQSIACGKRWSIRAAHIT